LKRIGKLFSKKRQLRPKKDTKKTDEVNEEEEADLFVERIRLEKMELRLLTGTHLVIF
jgi:hypothetical protein